ncbi:MAG: 50S ribosome-binding GTPase [Nitriliruptoraceae bacterium]|nr:50S ribosome-binding GTPase [Nitriliruptoraceae bacterium]
MPDDPHRTATTRPALILIGAESSGKSTLAAALSGRPSRAENVAGSTVAVETYPGTDRTIIDTPGVVHRLDTATSALALAVLDTDDTDVLLTLRATHLDDELTELLPVVAGRRGVVAVTNWDRVQDTVAARRAIAAVAAGTGVPFVAVDGRDPVASAAALRTALATPGRFTTGPVLARAGWRIEPPPTVLERRWLGPIVGLTILLAPAIASVWLAVTVAGLIEPGVEALLAPLATRARTLPWLLPEVVAGDYGLITMGPLLLVWAMPVVVVLALLLGVLKASGLLDRLTTAVHPLVRPFGLTGRDLVRVVAGHGCNVPAVISTRSCSGCTRDATIGAIAFGSACSFQLAATLGVLAAAGRPGLVVPYLAILLGGALVHARFLARQQGTDPVSLDLHLLRGRSFLSWPRWAEVRREARSTLRHVTVQALPIFLAITAIASLLAATGMLERAARPLEPLLAALRLPTEVALPVILASVRKDGLLLLAEPGTVAALDGAQLLAALVLAGALVPCLVTALTIARERGRRIAGRLLWRQALGALVLTGAVSWLGLGILRSMP